MVDASLRPRHLLIFGPPGSGKGTQAVYLAESLGIPAISTGEMLRRAVSEGTELGKKVESIINAGVLVDDETMAEVLEGRLRHADAQGGFLLDGYPRTTAQAETLDRILEASGRSLDAIVLLQVPAEELLRRALGRGRADDTEAVIRDRISIYEETTRQVLDHFHDRDLVIAIEGDRSIEEVRRAIADATGG